MSKVKVHRFWVEGYNSLSVGRFRLFVSKSDYDRLLKEHENLKRKFDNSHKVHTSTIAAMRG